MIASFQLCHAVLAWLSFAVGAAAAFVLGYRRWHKRFLPVAAVSVLFVFAGLEGGWAWWDKAGRHIQSVLSASLVQDASAAAVSCQVSAPISAAALNSGATWSYEIFGGTPNVSYFAKINWPGDPSNGSHPSSSISTDASGHGLTILPAFWSPDGFLPGFFDPANPGFFGNGYTAVPGSFTVQVYSGNLHGSLDTGAKGVAKYAGDVLL